MEPPTDVIGEFIDAAVQDEARARLLLGPYAATPSLDYDKKERDRYSGRRKPAQR
jgi:hypothetical protein